MYGAFSELEVCQNAFSSGAYSAPHTHSWFMSRMKKVGERFLQFFKAIDYSYIYLCECMHKQLMLVYSPHCPVSS